MLKRKYRLLFEILSKTIMSYSFSPKGITAAKLRCLAALVDKTEDINWADTFKATLLQEQKKFGTDAMRNVILEEKIDNLNKVYVILMDKMPYAHWNKKGLKAIQVSSKYR